MLEHGRHPEVEAAEFEAEQPARDLSGLPKLIISTAAVAVSLYALLWVVRPQPAQPYRTSFLAVTLAMTLLAYRPLARPQGRPPGAAPGGQALLRRAGPDVSRAGRAALVAAAGLLVAGAALAAVWAGGSRPAVVVTDQEGREVAAVSLPDEGRFALCYRHSVYRAEVTETFAAGDGGFRLVAIASPSEAVLDYYELEGRRAASGPLWRLEPAASPRLASLPLVATDVGRRTLVVGDRQVPLFAEGGAPAHLVLTVRR